MTDDDKAIDAKAVDDKAVDDKAVDTTAIPTGDADAVVVSGEKQGGKYCT